jgi:hypothetical protein
MSRLWKPLLERLNGPQKGPSSIFRASSTAERFRDSNCVLLPSEPGSTLHRLVLQHFTSSCQYFLWIITNKCYKDRMSSSLDPITPYHIYPLDTSYIPSSVPGSSIHPTCVIQVQVSKWRWPAFDVIHSNLCYLIYDLFFYVGYLFRRIDKLSLVGWICSWISSLVLFLSYSGSCARKQRWFRILHYARILDCSTILEAHNASLASGSLNRKSNTRFC